jgi:uncharacterized membrane protein YeaQ/YmgE (transglycosylase-associated protein family)
MRKFATCGARSDRRDERSALPAAVDGRRIGYKEAVKAQALSGRAEIGGKLDVQALIIWLVVGAIAGWLAGMVVKGSGYGLIGDIVVGILGGLIAGWLLPQLGIAIGGGFIAAIIDAFIGAVILLIALRLIRRVA